MSSCGRPFARIQSQAWLWMLLVLASFVGADLQAQSEDPCEGVTDPNIICETVAETLRREEIVDVIVHYPGISGTTRLTDFYSTPAEEVADSHFSRAELESAAVMAFTALGKTPPDTTQLVFETAQVHDEGNGFLVTSTSSSVTYTTTPDLAFTGDLNDLTTIHVLSGSINVVTTETTLETLRRDMVVENDPCFEVSDPNITCERVPEEVARDQIVEVDVDAGGISSSTSLTDFFSEAVDQPAPARILTQADLEAATDLAFQDLGETLPDPSTLSFTLVPLGSQSTTTPTNVEYEQTGDFVYIGDFLSDRGNVQVLQGSVNIITTETTTETRQFNLEVRDASAAEFDDTFYFPLFGDGAAGGIRLQSSLLLASVVPGDRQVVVAFYDRAGEPLAVQLGSDGPDTAFDLSFSGGSVYSAQSPAGGGLEVGYAIVKVRNPSAAVNRARARVRAQTGSSTAAEIGGTVVFTRTDSGVTVTEAGIPAARPLLDFTVLLDSIAARDTGLALVNPPGDAADPGTAANLVVRVWDQAFKSELGEVQLALAPGEAIGQFIWEIFQAHGASADLVAQLQETRAVVTVESDVPVAALTLRQNDDAAVGYPEEVPILTAFPVIPGRADAN